MASAGLLVGLWRRYFLGVGVWVVGACLLALGLGLGFVHFFPILPTVMVRGFNAFSHFSTRLGVVKPMDKAVAAAMKAPYNSWANRVAVMSFVKSIPVKPSHPDYSLLELLGGELKAFRKTPTLVCWGEKDIVFDMDILAVWKRELPEAEYHTFPRGGHFVLEDEPEAVSRLVREFLARNPLSGRSRSEPT